MGGTESYGQLDAMMPVSFPQYFPVFDYAATDMFIPSPMANEGDAAGRAYSPEGSMQTDWQDFVQQMNMTVG